MPAELTANETTPLVAKTSEGSVATYSQQTSATVSTSASYEQSSHPIHEEVEEVLGSMVVFPTPSQDAEVCQVAPVGEPSSKTQRQDEPVDASLIGDVVDEVQEVATAILHEFRDADDGEIHYLEMGLTRNLSILPSDVVDVATSKQAQKPLPTEEPQDVDLEAAREDPKETPSRPLFAYLLLFAAIIALASVGPLLQLQQETSAAMKIQWRMIGTTIVLIPFAVNEGHKEGMPHLTSAQWVTFLLSTFSYDVFSMGFVLALDYTSVGNATILANSLALILLVGKVCVGDRVSFMEGAGALVAFGGCVLCSKDSADSNGGSNGPWGDCLAICSALGGVGYLVFAKTCRRHIPIYTFMFMTMFVGTIMILPFQVIVMGEQVTFDLHPNHGLFGFLDMQADRLPLEVVIVVVCNVVGNMGYVQAMQYFDNLVLSSAALMEPAVAEFMAFSFGVGTLPSLGGWLGNFLVAAGTFAVVYADSPSEKKNEDEKEVA